MTALTTFTSGVRGLTYFFPPVLPGLFFPCFTQVFSQMRSPQQGVFAQLSPSSPQACAQMVRSWDHVLWFSSASALKLLTGDIAGAAAWVAPARTRYGRANANRILCMTASRIGLLNDRYDTGA